MSCRGSVLSRQRFKEAGPRPLGMVYKDGQGEKGRRAEYRLFPRERVAQRYPIGDPVEHEERGVRKRANGGIITLSATNSSVMVP